VIASYGCTLEKSTNASKVKPEQKFDATFRTFLEFVFFQRSKQKLHINLFNLLRRVILIRTQNFTSLFADPNNQLTIAHCSIHGSQTLGIYYRKTVIQV